MTGGVLILPHMDEPASNLGRRSTDLECALLLFSFFRFDHDTTVSESHQCFPVHAYRLLCFLGDTLMMGFGQGIGILFVIRSLAGRKRVYFTTAPRVQKRDVGQPADLRTPIDREGSERQKEGPSRHTTVRSLLRSKIEKREVVAGASTKSMSRITPSKGRPRIASRLDTKKY